MIQPAMRVSKEQFLEIEQKREADESAKNRELGQAILNAFYEELRRINPWKGLAGDWYAIDHTNNSLVHEYVKQELQSEGYLVRTEGGKLTVFNPAKTFVQTR